MGGQDMRNAWHANNGIPQLGHPIQGCVDMLQV
jgi:hypothetical protein